MALPGAGLASYRDIKGRALDWLGDEDGHRSEGYSSSAATAMVPI
jgi:hypothetical protein